MKEEKEKQERVTGYRAGEACVFLSWGWGWGRGWGVYTPICVCRIMLPPWRRRALEHSILTGLGFQDLRQESIREERRGGPLRDLGLGERRGGGECSDRAVEGWGEWSTSSCEGGAGGADILTA